MKKTYITPESVVLHVALTLPIAAVSDPNVKADTDIDNGTNPESFESKEGDAESWEPWED